MGDALNLRLIISRRGPPARPFGWEIVVGADSREIERSAETFRSRHEAIANGERILQARRSDPTIAMQPKP